MELLVPGAEAAERRLWGTGGVGGKLSGATASQLQ